MATAMLFIIDLSMPYYAKILRLTMLYRKVMSIGPGSLARRCSETQNKRMIDRLLAANDSRLLMLTLLLVPTDDPARPHPFLPVVPICRKNTTCLVGQITSSVSRILPR